MVGFGNRTGKREYHNLLAKTEITSQGKTTQEFTWDFNVVSMTAGESAGIYLLDELGSSVRLLGIYRNYQTVYGYDEFGQDVFGNQGEVPPYDKWLKFSGGIGINMRRMGAAAIDYVIVTLGFIFGLIIIIVVIYKGGYVSTNQRLGLMLSVGNIIPILYNFICDYFFSGLTIGKFIMKIRIKRGIRNDNFHFAVKHTLVKQLFLMLGWINIVIYNYNYYRMPYDKWLEITIEKF